MKRILLLLLPLFIFGQVTAKHGSCLWYPGHHGTTCDFDAVTLGTEFTVELWVKFNDISTEQVIAERCFLSGSILHGWYFALKDRGSGNKIGYHVGGLGGQAYSEFPVAPQVGVWYHIVAVNTFYDFGIYVNAVKGPDGSETIYEYAADIRIGTCKYYIASDLMGYTDEFRVYSRTLDSAEVAQNHLCPDAIYDTTGLLVWLPMNEYTGTDVGDSSGQGHHATTEVDWNIDTPVISAKFGTYDCNIHYPIVENPSASDRNWVGWCWDNAFTKVSELADYYCPNGVPISKFTKQTTEGLFSWLYHPVIGWYGTDFDLRMGHGLEVIATEDAVLWLQGGYFPDSVVELDDGNNWVSIPDNTVYVTISDIADDISPTGSAVEQFRRLRDDQLYESWIYDSFFGWFGTNWTLEAGEAIQFNCTKDTVWNPIEE